LETRLRNRFPPAISLKQRDYILEEEWYKIPIENVQNLHEFTVRRITPLLKAKCDPALD
jgi:hypothetical protein